jgi:thioredoxin reductase (NADPH)
MNIENVVIAGSGPAGLTSAIYTARAGLKPVVIEGNQPGGQITLTTTIENYPGFPAGVNGFELVERMKQQAERHGARFISSEVVSVNFKTSPFSVKLADATELQTKTMIIATGASPRYLGLKSEKELIGKGVSTCATCDGAFFRNRPVTVVGGGDSAMEEALFLATLASSVTIIHRRDKFRASKIMTERVLANPKIKVEWNSVVTEILDVTKQEVTAVRIKNVQTGKEFMLPTSAVFIAIGHIPNTQPFQGILELDAEGFIITTRTRTSIPGVFAAGDVQDPMYRQVATAVGSGCMAALEVQRYLTETSK